MFLLWLGWRVLSRSIKHTKSKIFSIFLQLTTSHRTFQAIIQMFQDGGETKRSSDIAWCDFRGEPSNPASLKPLSAIQEVSMGHWKASAEDLVFRNPSSFIAGELHKHVPTWTQILEGFHKKEEILKYLSNGVSIFDFFLQRFKGQYQGKSYESDIPPSIWLPNSKSCDKFEKFISEIIIERVRNGSLQIWGKEDRCIPPYLVMPITIEPLKPRMCHDEHFLNLWMKTPPVHFDSITDLPRYVERFSFQSKMDDKSGYDHILISEESKKFFGLYWQGWFFVYNTIPFGWSPSAYIYHTTGLGASHYIRSNGVPLTQYIDDRHLGQIQLPLEVGKDWSDLELANAAVFISGLVLAHCGYFIGIQKSVLLPQQSLSFLGFIVDSVRQAFILPEQKRRQFASLRDSISESRFLSVKTLQRFAEKAVSFALAVPAAKLYVRETNAHISKGIRSSK